jgi:hypothetical protein
MKLKPVFAFIFIGLAMILAGSLSALAQQEGEAAQTDPQLKTYMDTQWRWGEVISADAANKALTIKYLVFETDQEKELALVIDDSTVYENVKSLAEIQPKDILSVDFLVTDSQNIAKNISIEKPENLASGVKPELVQVSAELPQLSAPVENPVGAEVALSQPQGLPVIDQSKEVAPATPKEN